MGSNGSTSAAAPPLAGWMAEVRARLARRDRAALVPPAEARRAGVLLPLFVRNDALWILFTRRTETVEHHRGQISFPGGSEEPGDASLYHTALRETEEELGIASTDVLPLGRLSPIFTVTNFYVEPFVVAIPQPYELRPAEAEIAEVIEVPVAALLDPTILEKKPFPGREEMVLFYHYQEYVIWGATARILSDLLAALETPASSSGGDGEDDRVIG